MAYATRHTLQEYKGYFALSQIIYIENLLKSTNTQKQYTDIYKSCRQPTLLSTKDISEQNKLEYLFDC